jgi:hypothetical protein
LKLVRLDDPLGDLSGMPVEQRAEWVRQLGRQRLYEEMAAAEAEAWRRLFFWGITVIATLVAGVLVMSLDRYLPWDTRGMGRVVWQSLEWIGGGLLIVSGLSLVPTVFAFFRLLGALHRTRSARERMQHLGAVSGHIPHDPPERG